MVMMTWAMAVTTAATAPISSMISVVVTVPLFLARHVRRGPLSRPPRRTGQGRQPPRGMNLHVRKIVAFSGSSGLLSPRKQHLAG